MKRVHLPMAVAPTRRVVLRGLAATLLASLAGCGTDVRAPIGSAGDDGETDSTESGGTGGAGPASSGGGATSTGTGETSGQTSAPSSTPGTGFEMCGSELCIDLEQSINEGLRQVDGARILTVGTRKLLVVRTDDQTFVALSAICTHAGCTVSYAAGSRDVACPCHGSTFELDGSVTHGPAVTPLDVFPARYDAATNIVTITI